MRILHILTEGRLAGAERVVLDLCEEYRKLGHDSGVIILSPMPDLEDDNSSLLPLLTSAGIPWWSCNASSRMPWRLLRLRRLIRDWRPDVVHAHMYHPCLLTRLIGRGSWRLINTIHLVEKRSGKSWRFRLDRWTARLADVHTAVSAEAALWHENRLGLPHGAIAVIPNGIQPPPRLSVSALTELRQSWGLKEGEILIGGVGRLHEQKGWDILLRSMVSLKQEGLLDPSWRVVIIGEGAERLALQAQIERHQLPVLLPGFRTDAAACMAAFDLFVMPSRYEGFGLTLVEAMAHGLPILCSGVDSLAALSQHSDRAQCVDFSQDENLKTALHLGMQQGRGQAILPCSAIAMAGAYLQIYSR